MGSGPRNTELWAEPYVDRDRFSRECLASIFSSPQKKRELVGFGFEVGELGICEDEIEDGDAGLDVFAFMPAAVAKILSAEVPVHFAGE